MAFRATQVWIQVLALPLTGCVMLGKSCNSLSLSFPICTGRALSKVPGHKKSSKRRHLLTIWPHSDFGHTVLTLPSLAPWTKASSFCMDEAFPDTAEGWSALASLVGALE